MIDITSIQNKLLNDIKSSYGKNKLIPFTGAGFSKNIIGYPSWKEFIEIISDDISGNIEHIKEMFDNNYLQSIEYYMMSFLINENLADDPKSKDLGKEQLSKKLKEIFCKEFDQSTWEAQIALISLKNFDLIYTTNWDNTLEITCREILGEDRYRVYYRASQLENIKEDYCNILEHKKENRKKLIIKLHGDIKDYDSIVASEDAYYSRMNSFNAFDIVFQNDILLNDFLFMGFSFDDANINYLLQQIRSMKKEIKPSNNKVYLISIKKPDIAYYKLYEKYKNVDVYYLFNNMLEYEMYDKSCDEEKNRIIKNKTIEFFDYISDGELKEK